MQAGEQAVEIRSIGLLSYGRWMAVYNGLLGVLLAVVIAFIVDVTSDGERGTLAASILFVATRAVIGFVAGVIYGLFYNLIAGFGGLAVAVQPVAAPVAEEAPVAPGRPRELEKQKLEPAFILNATIGLWVVLAIFWLIGNFVVEGSYKDAKKHHERMSAAFSGESMISNYRLITAAERHGKLAVFYPSKRKRMATWVQEARLNLAQAYAMQNCPLAAAVWATRYLKGKKPTEEGRTRAEGVLAQAKTGGLTDEEIAAAGRLRFTCTQLKTEVTGRAEHGPTDWKVHIEYKLANAGPRPLKTELLCDFDPAGARGPLPEKELRPGQSVRRSIDFDTHAEGTTLATDVVLIPLRVTPQ